MVLLCAHLLTFDVSTCHHARKYRQSLPTHCSPSATTARDRVAACTFTSERTSSRFGYSNGLDWLQAEPMTCSILLKTSTSTFTIPIKRVFPTSFAQFAIRQVAFDPLEFDTSPMNLQVFCSKDMRAYTMDAIRRTTHESTSPTNRIDSIWIG